jgi:predicted O-methyltransferase YrrM
VKPWQQFVGELDDSHVMSTCRKHIAMLCAIIEGQAWRIAELGSHRGITAAALALAAPRSTIWAVDLCDTVPEPARIDYWKGLGLDNIRPVHSSASDYLSSLAPGGLDFVYHDAAHGPSAFFEYLGCVEIASTVAIHDWELLPPEMQQAVAAKFSTHSTDSDERGRLLFVGHK